MYYCHECGYYTVRSDAEVLRRCSKCGSYDWDIVTYQFVVSVEYAWTDGDYG